MRSSVLNKRESSIELLRIIAMFCIVLNHSTGHRVTDDSTFYETNFINGVILQCSLLGALGSNIFMIITGYFASNKDFKISKIVKLCFQVWFYSWIILLLIIITGMCNVSIKDIIRNLFPILFSNNWYISVYILFCFFIPFINILLDSLERDKHKALSLISTILWGVVPTLTHFSMYGSELLTFFMMFCIGGYIRKYPKSRINTLKIGVTLTTISLIILFSSTVLLDIFGNYIGLFKHNGNMFYGRTSMPIIGASVGLLIIFINIHVRPNKWINCVGASTLGIYLISENYFLRDLIWGPLFNWDKGINSPFMFADMLIKCAFVFIVSSIIDIIRINYIEPNTGLLQHAVEKRIHKLGKRIIDNKENN